MHVLAVGNQLRPQAPYRTGRHGEAHTRRGSTGADDLRVHADNLARQVKQWPPRVPGVDRRIGLNGLTDEPVVLRALNDSAQCTDYTCGTSSGVGFAVSASTVRRVVPPLIANGKNVHPMLGVRLISLTAANKAALEEAGAGGAVDSGALVR